MTSIIQSERVRRELLLAIDATSRTDLAAWAARSGRVLLGAAVRRVRNIERVGSCGIGILKGETDRLRRSGSLRVWARAAGEALSSTANDRIGAATNLWRKLREYARNNPRTAASRLALFCFGFHAGSGGIDGDGGIPDLDWELLESHRSLLTHSVVPGIVVEVIVASLVDLVSTIHTKLPSDHDPCWDSIRFGSLQLNAIAGGVSWGLAHHLGVDALVDSDGNYAGLPIDLPQEGHQAIAGVLGATEGLDGITRAKGLVRGDTVATYGSFSAARSAVKASATPMAFVVAPIGSMGYRVRWMPKKA